MIRQAIMTMLLLGAAAGPARAGPAAPETRIREMGRYLEAIVDPHHGAFIRAVDGHWYYARTLDDCPRLTPNATLRFEPSPGGYFDHHSAIRADGWRCMVASVTASAPPREARRH